MGVCKAFPKWLKSKSKLNDEWVKCSLIPCAFHAFKSKVTVSHRLSASFYLSRHLTHTHALMIIWRVRKDFFFSLQFNSSFRLFSCIYKGKKSKTRHLSTTLVKRVKKKKEKYISSYPLVKGVSSWKVWKVILRTWYRDPMKRYVQRTFDG